MDKKKYVALGENVLITIITEYPDTKLILGEKAMNTRKDMKVSLIVKSIGDSVPNTFSIEIGDKIILGKHAQMDAVIKLKEEKRGTSGLKRTDNAFLHYSNIIGKEI